MSLSPVAYFGSLDPTNPQGTDSRTISDDQHRNILQSNRDQCPSWTGEVTANHTEVNYLSGYEAAGVKPMPGEPNVTVLYAYNSATPPVYWTIEAPDTNVRELVIGPEASGGTIGGTQDPTDMQDTVSITVSGTTGAVGDHVHSVSLATGTPSATTTAEGGVASVMAASNHSHSVTGDTDGGGGHDHSFSGSDSDGIQLTPRYARGILMKFTG